jgi:ribose 5-phosphate isomerase B
MPDPAKPLIILGADHAGYQLKESIKNYLRRAGYTFEDMGTTSEESVDYPDFARPVAERVAAGGKNCLGILTCGNGLGMAVAANKVPGIRSIAAHDAQAARDGRERIGVNVLSLGSKIMTEEQAMKAVGEYLGAEFAGGRHQRRIDKISEIEKARVR